MAGMVGTYQGLVLRSVTFTRSRGWGADTSVVEAIVPGGFDVKAPELDSVTRAIDKPDMGAGEVDSAPPGAGRGATLDPSVCDRGIGRPAACSRALYLFQRYDAAEAVTAVWSRAACSSAPSLRRASLPRRRALVVSSSVARFARAVVAMTRLHTDTSGPVNTPIALW